MKLGKQKVLVFPCGSEIGLEIYRALKNSIHFEVYGGSSCYDHGGYVYERYIGNLPYISDNSAREEIIAFNDAIKEYEFDFIYPAMDNVVTVFSKYRNVLNAIVITPSYETTEITRSKRKTYDFFANDLPIPQIYSNIEDIVSFPIFVKPDIGQGSVGAVKVNNKQELLKVKKNDDSQLMLELLPGNEYTIDCFTNGEGELLYYKGRTRKRIKNGISVNTVFYEHPEFERYAKIINEKLNQKGAWFFQLKEDAEGKLKLLEIASRIAGASAIERNIGVNLPLLSLYVFAGISIKEMVVNNYTIELDRALENIFKIKLDYNTIYIDYDDTIVTDGVINTQVVSFLYQCINNGKSIILLSKHEGDLYEELKKYRLDNIFDKVYHLKRDDKKSDYIVDKTSIFIDDSYRERKEIYNKHGINVFDTHMIECLLEH